MFASRTSRRPRRSYRPMLESLTDRIAPATLAPGFNEVTLAAGLVAPTAMEVAPDGRIFITEQTGAIRIVQNNQLLPTPFATLTVDSTGERGLLGITLDPSFTSNSFVYVYYTTPANGVHNRISRFTANGNVAAGAETVLVDLDPLSAASNHNGGAIHFGNDGKLYVGVGENGNPANSQSLDNRLGKILRYNADGTIPGDNPATFAGITGSTTGANRAIWAVGLRNPFTFGIQPGTGRIFVNDVGQNTFEEINDGAAGRNFGWPNVEGAGSNPAYTNPLFVYGHGQGTSAGFAISGGAFARSDVNPYPPDVPGDYFFADFVNRWVRRLDPATGAVDVIASDVDGLPVDLRVDGSGNLLYLARDSSVGGVVRGLTFSPTPAQRFVENLYQDFLGRSATLDDLTHWTTQINNNGRLSVADQIARSTEALGRTVDGIYAHMLGRGADADGRTFWIGQLAGGRSVEQIISGFAASDEFAARANSQEATGDSSVDYVRSLYRVFLARTSVSGSEVAIWTAQFGNGRASLAMQFAVCDEFRQRAVAGIYGPTAALPFLHTLLGRSGPPEISEINSWALGKLDVKAIETLFAASDEYFAIS